MGCAVDSMSNHGVDEGPKIDSESDMNDYKYSRKKDESIVKRGFQL